MYLIDRSTARPSKQKGKPSTGAGRGLEGEGLADNRDCATDGCKREPAPEWNLATHHQKLT